jgi:hypothetical protein
MKATHEGNPCNYETDKHAKHEVRHVQRLPLSFMQYRQTLQL